MNILEVIVTPGINTSGSSSVSCLLTSDRRLCFHLREYLAQFISSLILTQSELMHAYGNAGGWKLMTTFLCGEIIFTHDQKHLPFSDIIE